MSRWVYRGASLALLFAAAFEALVAIATPDLDYALVYGAATIALAWFSGDAWAKGRFIADLDLDRRNPQ